MRDRRRMLIAGLLALVLIAAPGCVSTGLFKKNSEETDSRVAAVEDAVEDTDRKLTTLKKETDQRFGSVEKKASDASSLGREAMTTAEAAKSAAEGKLLWSVTLSNDDVKFPFGQTKLDSNAVSALDALVGKIKGYGKAVYLEIQGHTDSVGDEQYNLALSHKRAMGVRDYLAQNGGIPLHAMSTIAIGEADPVADNSTSAGRSQNRRVVVRVLE